MPRTIPAGLATIIASGSASLGTIFEITRRDKVVVRLTDSDQNLTVLGNVFAAASGGG